MRSGQLKRLLAICAFLFFCAAGVFSQEADNNRTQFPSKADDQPKSIREIMQKMRIDQEKKDYQEMLDRAEQALKISDELERSFSQNSKVTRSNLEQLASLEKVVKKIRGDLGGENDEGTETDDPDDNVHPKSAADGFKVLQSLTFKLADEIKKTTRFTISAAAIQSSNAVLRVVRFLRLSK
jgi:hypothetical protein